MEDKSKDFLETLKHLLRLTGGGKIAWRRAEPTHANGPRSYRGRHGDLEFELFEDPGAQSGFQPFEAFARYDATRHPETAPGTRYVLRIIDHADDGAEVESPPMEAATDVALAIRARLRAQSHAQQDKIESINERLAQG